VRGSSPPPVPGRGLAPDDGPPGSPPPPYRCRSGTNNRTRSALFDAVMHHRDPVGRDRMGVLLVRLAVRRPTGMADPNRALYRLALQPGHEVGKLAFGAPALDPAVGQGRDAGGVVAASREPLAAALELRRAGL